MSLLLSTFVVIFVYKIMQRLVLALPLSRFSEEPNATTRRRTANSYLYIIGMFFSQGKTSIAQMRVSKDLLIYCHHSGALCFKKLDMSHCGWRLVFGNFRHSAILRFTSNNLHHRPKQFAAYRVS